MKFKLSFKFTLFTRFKKLLKRIGNNFVEAVKDFFNFGFVRPYKFVAKGLRGLLIDPILRVGRLIYKKYDFFCGKLFPSRASEVERKKYILFVNSLGGGNNVSAFSCRAKSGHLKIIHSFLIDGKTLKLFNIEIVSYAGPYLDLSLGSYSRGIFKRLKKFTNKPNKKNMPECPKKRY